MRRRAELVALILAALALPCAALPPPPSPSAKPLGGAPAPAKSATPKTATPSTPAPRNGKEMSLGDSLVGGVREGRVEAWTIAKSGEGWQALTRRVVGDAAPWKQLADANAAGEPRAGARVVIPRALWRDGLGARLLLALFPRDAPTPEGWRHVVTRGEQLSFAESPWSLAQLFMGDGHLHERFVMDPAIRKRGLRPGDVLGVRGELLLPCWRPEGASEDTPQRKSSPAQVASAPAPGKPVARAAPPPAKPIALAPTVAQAKPVVPATSTAPPAPKAPPAPAQPVIEGSGGLASEGTGTLTLRLPAPPSESAAPPDEEIAHGEDRPVAGEPMEEPPTTTAPAATPPPEVEGADDPELAPAASAPAAPARDDFSVTPGQRSQDGVLTFALDKEGPHAVYRLQKGETLYTHVVLRFTGLLAGKDVNDAAKRFAHRSRIKDVTQIAVGTRVRIPLADLLPQYLPLGHPRRLAQEQEQAQSTRLAGRERRELLDGVHVVLDSGHGGADPGAGDDEVWEDDYVYDVACRVKQVLESRTRATVHPLVRDESSGHAPQARIKRDRDEVLLSKPVYKLDEHPSRSAVNLRWVLSNELFRNLSAQRIDDDRVIFLSFHADSLHESATGAMVYYASAALRPTECGVPRETSLTGVKEVAACNDFSMSKRQLLRSEGLSRALGETIIAALREDSLATHGFSPVRGSIIRAGAWVPAVLKYNRVPAAVLIETCNLNNREDRKSLRDPSFRQRFAESVVDGLEQYFDGRGDAPSSERASR